MRQRRLFRWYGRYRGRFYALGPIEAPNKTAARRWFREHFGRWPTEVWRA